jgi:hypothetical protein
MFVHMRMFVHTDTYTSYIQSHDIAHLRHVLRLLLSRLDGVQLLVLQDLLKRQCPICTQKAAPMITYIVI